MNAAEFDRHDFIYSFAQVWKRIMTDPQEFFAEMPLTGGLGNPLIFVIISLAIAGVGTMAANGGGLKGILLILGGGILQAFIGTVLLLLIARQLFEGAGDFEATFRVCAYAGAPAVLIWVPVVKFIAVLYGIYLLILGLQRAHRYDSVRAALTLLLTAAAGSFLSLPFGGPPGVSLFIRL